MSKNLGLNREIPVLDWESHLAERTRNMQSSAIRELLKITQDPEVISFAGGLPAPEVFPIREVDEACSYVLQKLGKKALQYSATEGYYPLKEFLASSMHKYGIPALPENVLLTNGSQQALDLVGRIFIDPGTYVLSGRPTYLGAIQAWGAYQAKFHTMRVDEHGMVVDEIEHAYEKALKESGRPPAFIYVLPNFHNPAGTTLPLERREKLAEIATKLDIAVVFCKVKKVKRGYYEASFKTITLIPKEFKDYEITDIFMQLVEEQIYEAPEFYLWTHKRWKHKDNVPPEFQ